MTLANFQPTLAPEWFSALTLIATQLTLPTTDWTDFSPEKNILIILARGLEASEVAAVERWRGSFLSYAEGEALDTLSEQTYRTPRLAATIATTLVTFTNGSITTYVVDAGDYLTLQVSDDETVGRYRVDGPLTLPPGATTGVLARAESPGSASNVAPGDIDTIEGSSFPDVSVTNTTSSSARDVESDPDLRSRASRRSSSLSIAGPSEAYEYFARGGEQNGEVDTTVAAIGVTRVKVTTDEATGAVTAYYATGSGGISGTETTGNLGTINAKVLLRVVPTGTEYRGLSAAPLTINLSYVLYVRDDLFIDEQQLKDAVEARAVAYLTSPIECPIGGPPETSPTPGYTGAITASKTRGLATDIELNGSFPVVDATNSINTLGAQLVEQNEVPVPGTITISVVYLPPQTP